MNFIAWPPSKAWTCTANIDGQRHFVAINYGGEKLDRWVDLISVMDSNVIIKVSWEQLLDESKWKIGWLEDSYINSSEKVEIIKITNFTKLSDDSGLTIPITKKQIRPWFINS